MGATERTATIDMGGRGGDVFYTDERGPLRFPWEMSSFGIEIPVPSAAEWEERTGLPVDERLDTLRFIAECALAQRGQPHSKFEIVEGRFPAIQIHL
jgi:hypothetical protein